jgi:hypothetical protein
MSYKKDFKKLKDVAVYGAMASQSTGLLTTYKSNPSGSIAGMVGVGVAGGIANASFRLASGQGYRKRKR